MVKGNLILMAVAAAAFCWAWVVAVLVWALLVTLPALAGSPLPLAL